MQQVKQEYLALTDECDDCTELIKLEKIVDYADEPDGSTIGLSLPKDAEVVFLSPEQARGLAAGLIQLVKELDAEAKERNRNKKIKVKAASSVAIES